MSNEGQNRGITFTGDDPRIPAYHTHAEEGEFRFPIPPGQRVIGVKFRRLPGGEPAIVEALYAPEKKEKILGTYMGINFVESTPYRGAEFADHFDRALERGKDLLRSSIDPENPGLYGAFVLDMLDERERRQMDGKDQVGNQPLQGPPSPLRPKGLAVGRNVHYVWREGLHLAAIVTSVQDREAGIVRLAVFDYWSEDTSFFDDVSYDPSGERERTWHFIEYAE